MNKDDYSSFRLKWKDFLMEAKNIDHSNIRTVMGAFVLTALIIRLPDIIQAFSLFLK